MNEQIYQIVKDAIEQHSLDCKCYICEAFVNEENGSKGHAAACLAVADRLAGIQNLSVLKMTGYEPDIEQCSSCLADVRDCTCRM